ncbi:MAG TPA: succinate dehydrogenase iron-sulfur subunit [Firmicutes bacterium]|nr:succinate dehydrogenase iron-sulfur subunit [Bacillota bacterium]
MQFTIFRFDPEREQEPHYSTYEVPVQGGTTLLEALLWIVDNADGSLSFRYACREAICGACAMFVNGKHRLACKTQVQDLRAKEVVVHPLPHLPVIKDLVVDMTGFWEKYRAIRPYLIAEGLGDREFFQNAEDRMAIDEMLNCILCGCCYSSCPMVWTNPEYLGPAALLKAYRFVRDTRDQGGRDRLALVAGEDGVWRCHTVFNCAEACPKDINVTWSIQALKRKLSRAAVGLR